MLVESTPKINGLSRSRECDWPSLGADLPRQISVNLGAASSVVGHVYLSSHFEQDFFPALVNSLPANSNLATYRGDVRNVGGYEHTPLPWHSGLLHLAPHKKLGLRTIYL